MDGTKGRGVQFAAAAVLLAAALASAGFAANIKAVAGENIDFRQYKTYQWAPTKFLGKAGVEEDNPTLTPIIKAAVNKELTARGLREVTEGGDLEVVTLALQAYIPQLEAVLFPMGMDGMYYATPIATMGRYNREGTFAINLIDLHAKKSAWAGMITQSIDNKPGAGAKKIPGATEKLFQKFPIKK